MWARAISAIERNARAESQIVSDLLDINRLVGGHLRIDFAPLDVAAAVAQAVEAANEALAMGQELRVPGVIVDATTTLTRMDERSGDPENSQRRLLEIGFVEGAQVEVLYEGVIGRDPIAVRVDGITVAVRRREAMAVIVA